MLAVKCPATLCRIPLLSVYCWILPVAVYFMIRFSLTILPLLLGRYAGAGCHARVLFPFGSNLLFRKCFNELQPLTGGVFPSWQQDGLFERFISGSGFPLFEASNSQ